MPRVYYVKKARKDNPACKAGESYYWWKFRFGGKHYSLTMPKASQLTQSAFLSQVYELNERIEELQPESIEDLQFEIDELSNEFQNLSDECQGNLDNMPEHLQETSEAGMLLQERIDGCESVVSDLESIDTDIDEDAIRDEVKEELEAEDDPEEEIDKETRKVEIEEGVKSRIQDRLEEIISEVQSIQYDGG